MIKKSLAEYMNERSEISRWKIAKVFTVGVFCGVAMGVVYMWGIFLL